MGLVGSGGLSMLKSSFSGTLTSTSSYLGGLVAISNNSTNLSISDSYSAGTFSGGLYQGGLIGLLYNGSVSYSYTSASLTTGTTDYQGGLVAFLGTGGGTGLITDSFSAATLNGSPTFSKGGITGYENGTANTTYFDQYLAGTSQCTGGGLLSCTAVNSGNSSPNYFKNNSTNMPMADWNFANVWKITAGYPALIVANPPVIISAPSNSSGPFRFASTTEVPTCNDMAPSSAPDLFQVNASATDATLFLAPAGGQVTSYFIAFGFAPGDTRFGEEVPYGQSTGVISFPIHSLSPNTTYYFTVRAGHGCRPGDWSNTFTMKTTSNGTKILYR